MSSGSTVFFKFEKHIPINVFINIHYLNRLFGLLLVSWSQLLSNNILIRCFMAKVSQFRNKFSCIRCVISCLFMSMSFLQLLSTIVCTGVQLAVSPYILICDSFLISYII